MARTKDNLVSILGESYFQPIADLVDRWLATTPAQSNPVQSGLFERGYAASVVLLIVAMFESYMVRVRYIHGATVPTKRRTALAVLEHLYPRLRHRKALKEVYVLRDVLTHNHLWNINYSWSDSSSMMLHEAKKDLAFGDKKFSECVNPKTRRTKALGLHVVPTRIDRRDAKRVFETIWKTLLFLESKNRNQCYVSHRHVQFKGKLALFGDLIGHF